MENCSKLGCTEKAEYVPKVHLPMAGFSAGAEQIFDGILGIKLCATHVRSVKVKEFANFKSMVGGLLKGAEVSWDRVYFTAVKIDSEEYKAWEKD
jgi:hypothetical protein